MIRSRAFVCFLLPSFLHCFPVLPVSLCVPNNSRAVVLVPGVQREKDITTRTLKEENTSIPMKDLGSRGSAIGSAQLCGSAEAEHHLSPTVTLSYTLSTSAKASCCTALKSHRSRSAPGSCCPPSSDQHRVLLMTLEGFNETAQPAGK